MSPTLFSVASHPCTRETEGPALTSIQAMDEAVMTSIQPIEDWAETKDDDHDLLSIASRTCHMNRSIQAVEGLGLADTTPVQAAIHIEVASHCCSIDQYMQMTADMHHRPFTRIDVEISSHSCFMIPADQSIGGIRLFVQAVYTMCVHVETLCLTRRLW